MRIIQMLPITGFFAFQGTFIISYFIALYNGHVNTTIPYISETAILDIEKNFFSQLINIGCIILGLIVYVRFYYVLELLRVYPRANEKCTLILNKISNIFAVITCIGISVLANFQAEMPTLYIHYTGAFCCFIFGIVYFWIHGFISYRTDPIKKMYNLKAHIRILIAFSCTAFAVVGGVTGIITRVLNVDKSGKEWKWYDGEWCLFAIPRIMEWIIASLFSAYLLTFHSEFEIIIIAHPEIIME